MDQGGGLMIGIRGDKAPPVKLNLFLDRVKELLLETALSIASIARRAGFEREEYMNVAFKRTFGVTPGTYRRNRGGPPGLFEKQA